MRTLNITLANCDAVGWEPPTASEAVILLGLPSLFLHYAIAPELYVTWQTV